MINQEDHRPPGTVLLLAASWLWEAAAGSALGVSTENKRLQVWRLEGIIRLERLDPGEKSEAREEQTGCRHSSKHSDSSVQTQWRKTKKGGEPPRVRPWILSGHGCPDHTHTSAWRLRRPTGDSTYVTAAGKTNQDDERREKTEAKAGILAEEKVAHDCCLGRVQTGLDLQLGPGPAE